MVTVSNNNVPPDFDPLNPSDAEAAEMVAGYGDGYYDRPPPRITSAAYDHGRRNGVSDRTGNIDEDQRALARRALDRIRAKLK